VRIAAADATAVQHAVVQLGDFVLLLRLEVFGFSLVDVLLVHDLVGQVAGVENVEVVGLVLLEFFWVHRLDGEVLQHLPFAHRGIVQFLDGQVVLLAAVRLNHVSAFGLLLQFVFAFASVTLDAVRIPGLQLSLVDVEFVRGALNCEFLDLFQFFIDHYLVFQIIGGSHLEF